MSVGALVLKGNEVLECRDCGEHILLDGSRDYGEFIFKHDGHSKFLWPNGSPWTAPTKKEYWQR